VEIKKRSPILAPLLSIVSPGLGQMYNGQLGKGIIYYLFGYLLFFLISLIGLQFKFYGLMLIFALIICVLLLIMGDALIVALKKKEIVLRPYNRWYFYILFATLAFGISEISDVFIKVDPFGGIKAYSIPTGTMIPTLMIGDRIIINLDYYKTNEVKRGDIIVFKYPENPKKDFIKRVVATGGDKIESKNKVIYLNGKKIDESYVQHTDSAIFPHEFDSRDNFLPLTVPENKFFVMGDNRDQSHDSRFWGFVDINDIQGKALYVYWTEDKSRIGREIK